MATVLKSVPSIAHDDGVRERHGVTNSDGSYVGAIEDGHLIAVTVAGTMASQRVTISPSKARYLASRLRRLARRIEEREVGK